MKTRKQLIAALDACLPQTQCQLCTYSGCQPYAIAMVDEEAPIDRCLPGGVETLCKIAHELGKDPAPYLDGMRAKAKPPMLAVIREEQCIGCTKCIAVCPVDAIIGAAKLMHTIIREACTGCELCMPVCPMDCIDLVQMAERAPIEQQRLAEQSRQRYTQRMTRLLRKQQQSEQIHQEAKLQQLDRQQTVQARQTAIAAALARVRTKKAMGVEAVVENNTDTTG